MKSYHEIQFPFVKNIPVEIDEEVIIPVEVTVHEFGQVERTLPEEYRTGKLNQLQVYAIDDAVEADVDVQYHIQYGEESYRRAHDSEMRARQADASDCYWFSIDKRF